MTSELALGLAEEMLWVALLVGAPVIGAAMVVGLLVSVFQVVTQIQEMTLTFVPKLITIFFVILIAGAWMLGVLVNFGTTMFTNIPVYAG